MDKVEQDLVDAIMTIEGCRALADRWKGLRESLSLDTPYDVVAFAAIKTCELELRRWLDDNAPA